MFVKSATSLNRQIASTHNFFYFLTPLFVGRGTNIPVLKKSPNTIKHTWENSKGIFLEVDNWWWSDLLVLQNYGVIISECQKVNFFWVKARKLLSKCEKTQSCLKLKLKLKIDRNFFLKVANFFLGLVNI